MAWGGRKTCSVARLVALNVATCHTLMERHYLSAIWGDMEEAQYADLVRSVQHDGLDNPTIIVLDGMILDGWHRYNAAMDGKVSEELKFEDYVGTNPADLVIRANSLRRHLNAGQRVSIVQACHEWRTSGGRPSTMPKPSDFLETFATEVEPPPPPPNYPDPVIKPCNDCKRDTSHALRIEVVRGLPYAKNICQVCRRKTQAIDSCTYH